VTEQPPKRLQLARMRLQKLDREGRADRVGVNLDPGAGTKPLDRAVDDSVVAFALSLRTIGIT
jgi:hypothetical protein